MVTPEDGHRLLFCVFGGEPGGSHQAAPDPLFEPGCVAPSPALSTGRRRRADASPRPSECPEGCQGERIEPRNGQEEHETRARRPVQQVGQRAGRGEDESPVGWLDDLLEIRERPRDGLWQNSKATPARTKTRSDASGSIHRRGSLRFLRYVPKAGLISYCTSGFGSVKIRMKNLKRILPGRRPGDRPVPAGIFRERARSTRPILAWLRQTTLRGVIGRIRCQFARRRPNGVVVALVDPGSHGP
jgi:hypothetical protein